MNTQDSPNPEECRRLLKSNPPAPHTCVEELHLELWGKEGKLVGRYCSVCGDWEK